MVELRMNEFEQFLSFERCVGIVLILVASIGIIGNLFTILFRPENSSRAGNLVFSLAIFDVVFLICAFLLFGIPLISENYKKHHRKNILPFTYGLAHLSRVGSVFTILSISIQHFLVVRCYSKERQVGGLLIPISWLAATIFNIPRFYEFKKTSNILVDVRNNDTIIPYQQIINIANFSSTDQEEYAFHETYTQELRNNPYYVILYLFWGRLILIELIPLIIIITINVIVRRQLRTLSHASNRSHDDVQEGISKVTTILFARSFLYVVCQSIKIIPDVYEVFACKPFHFEIGECPYNSTQAINKLIDIGHLFLAINSCGNILLYIVFGKSFRDSLVQIFPVARVDRQSLNENLFQENYEMAVVENERNHAREETEGNASTIMLNGSDVIVPRSF